MPHKQHKPFHALVAIVAGMLTVSMVFLIMALVVGCGKGGSVTSFRTLQRAVKAPEPIHHSVQPERRARLSSP